MSSDTPTINMAATGANIKALIRNKGLKVADVQARCGFHTPQAIFKWMRGDAMPTIDNMVILAHMLDVTIDKIIILN
jgi:transcriptional regulator with XRE-family HTH domain